MRSDLVAAVPKRRAVDTSTRIEVANVFTLDAHFSLSLPAIVAGLAGAAAIVYVTKRHDASAHKALQPPESSENVGIAQLRP